MNLKSISSSEKTLEINPEHNLNINNSENLKLKAKLEQKFQSFSPQRQAHYSIFYKTDLQTCKLLIDSMLEEQNHEYEQKILGPKLKHCSKKTREFCLQWFKSEINISYREDAIVLYESRIVIEEELTYIFESFDEHLQKKYNNFYENEFDGKNQILETMTKEKQEQEKVIAKFAELKTNFQKEILKTVEQSKISPQESNEISLKLESITTDDQLQKLYIKFKEIQSTRQKNLRQLKEQTSPEHFRKLITELLKRNVEEQQQFIHKLPRVSK